MKTLLTLVLLFVSSVALAAGTNISSGFSTTIGTAHTTIDQHGNYNSQGGGISLAYTSNSNGSDFRKEIYSVETETDTQGYGTISDIFVSTSRSNSAGLLSTSKGRTTGTSILSMETEAHTDVYGGGYYTQISHSNTENSNSFNYEAGSFDFHTHELAETDINSATFYTTHYSNSSFNY